MQGEIKWKNWSSSNPKKYPWTGLKNSYKRNLNENIYYHTARKFLTPYNFSNRSSLKWSASDQFRITDFGNSMGTQWISSSISICFSGNFLLAGRCGRNSTILEGKCWWEKDNSCRVCALNILTKHFRPIDRIKKSYKWVNFKTQTTDSACLPWKRYG